MEDNMNIITLTDEDGVDFDMELIDVFPYQGKEYVVLLPVEDEDGDTLILEIEDNEDGEESLLSVEDTDILEAVFEMFKQKYADEFDFVD